MNMNLKGILYSRCRERDRLSVKKLLGSLLAVSGSAGFSGMSRNRCASSLCRERVFFKCRQYWTRSCNTKRISKPTYSHVKQRNTIKMCDRCHTWEGAALKKTRRSFQANRYPRMQQCSMPRGCTTANSPTCTLPKILSTSSSVAVSIDIIASGGDLQNKRLLITLILFSCSLYKHNLWDIFWLMCCFQL